MTSQDFIELAKEHLTEEWCEENGNGWVEFAGTPNEIIEFAKAIYDRAYTEGCYDTSIDLADAGV
jgi:hypothetical protein